VTDVAHIVIAGRGRNALGTAVMTRVLEDLAAAGAAPLLLSGAPGAFSAGLDLREVTSLSPADLRAYIVLFERLVATVYQHPAPTVALINGHAIAGGCVMALCCDVRVAAADPAIKIGLNEVTNGVVFPPRTLAVVRAQLPPVRQREILLGADVHAPERARALGLVDEVAADAEAVARAHLERLAQKPRAAYAWVKRDLRGSAPTDLASDAALEAYLDGAAPIWCGAELKQRVAQLLGKA
jgi:enoyl-CoA hydratase/carnithine racemase